MLRRVLIVSFVSTFVLVAVAASRGLYWLWLVEFALAIVVVYALDFVACAWQHYFTLQEYTPSAPPDPDNERKQQEDDWAKGHLDEVAEEETSEIQAWKQFVDEYEKEVLSVEKAASLLGLSNDGHFLAWLKRHPAWVAAELTVSKQNVLKWQPRCPLGSAEIDNFLNTCVLYPPEVKGLEQQFTLEEELTSLKDDFKLSAEAVQGFSEVVQGFSEVVQGLEGVLDEEDEDENEGSLLRLEYALQDPPEGVPKGSVTEELHQLQHQVEELKKKLSLLDTLLERDAKPEEGE